MARKSTKESGKAHQFGGSWTQAKLTVLARYLQRYTTALKEKPSKERQENRSWL